MKKKIFSILFALMLVCSFSLVTAVPTPVAAEEGADYTIIDLGGGTTPGSCGFGLNNSGQVVGWSSYGSADKYAFLWSHSEGIENLGNLGYSESKAQDINSSGMVVGFCGGTYDAAFVWPDPANPGQMKALPIPGEYSGGSAFGINSSNNIVGALWDGAFHPVYWAYDGVSQSWSATVLPKLEDDSIGFARGINDSGVIVGYEYNASGKNRACMWQYAEGAWSVTDLGTLMGNDPEYASWARDINNSGQVVGESQFGAKMFDVHAFLWDSENGMQDLGSLGGPSRKSKAYGINDAGVVVVYSQLPTGYNWIASIWDATNGMRALIDLLEPGHDWTALDSAWDINNYGCITGNGKIGGETHAFLIAPRPTEVWVDDNFAPFIPGWGYEFFASIQDGIDIVAEGGTVNVAAGAYEENVVIDRKLTLQGEDRETTEIKFGYDYYPSPSPLTISADGITVSGFTIRSGPYIELGGAWTIAVGGDSAFLTDLHVIKEPCLHQFEGDLTNKGAAIGYVSPNIVGFTFTESTVDSAWNGIYTREGSSDILVKKVDFTCPGENAIFVKAITSATIERNKITFTEHIAGEERGQYGVTITRGSDNIDIIDNQFVGSDPQQEPHIGILLQAYPAEGTMGDVTILDNEISGFNTGISVEDVDTSEISIHFNHITGNTYGVDYIGPNMVDATNNWWGDASGPDDDAEVINGSGDKISVNVDADPWITGEVEHGAVDSADVTGSDPGGVDLQDDEDNTIATVDISGGDAPSGTITGARYTEEPEEETSLSVGTGTTGVVFLDVQVTGYTEGIARITVPYLDDNQDGIVDGTDIDETTLGLYYWDEAWCLADKNAVNPDENTVSGDIPISALTGAPIGMGGYLDDEALVAIDSILNLSNKSDPNSQKPDTVELTIDTNTAFLGAATIDLTFDPMVVEVLGVVAESSDFDILTVNPDYTHSGTDTQTARFLAYQSEATGAGVDANGGAVVAVVQLKAVGNTMDFSSLELEVITLKDNKLDRIPSTLGTLSFALVGGVGDANRDTYVDSDDLVEITRAILGFSGYSSDTPTMNVDGKDDVDAADCTYLARHLVEVPDHPLPPHGWMPPWGP